LRPRPRAIGSSDLEAGEYWQVLRLPRSDAVQLGKDALACLKRHQQRRNARANAYLVHFAFAPR
jgi:hypothetical protein